MSGPRRALATLGVVVLVVLGANVYTMRSVRSWDFTAERSATLSEQTRAVLRQLNHRVEITAFFPRDAVGRVEASTLLSRFRKANRRISFRIIDPVLAPGEAQRLGIDAIGSAAVQTSDPPRKIEIAQYTIEIDITSAIARLLRNVSGTVCFSTGHGERAANSSDGRGLADAAEALTANG